jgi:hypothetical protein
MSHSPLETQPPGPFGKAGAAVSSDLATIIIEYATPLLQHCVDFRGREKAISYAILAWNLSLEKSAVQDRERREIEEMIEPEEREQIHQLFDFLIQRKLQMFPDNRFYIVDYELDETEGKMQIRMDTKYVTRA